MSLAKHWCFTINNPGPLDSPVYDPSIMAYLVVGKETGSSGTFHLQGYVCFTTKKRFNAVRKLWPTAHIEVMRSSPQNASAYCKKDGSFNEYGTLPALQTSNATSKRKADYALAVELSKKQKIYDVDASLLVRHHSSLKAIARDHPMKLDDLSDVCGVWLYGAPGTGKSRGARWLYPNAYFKPCNKWWDGYRSEPYVIIDDLDTNHACLGHFLKIWSDRYAFMAEQKGHSILIRPSIICVTSNYSPTDLFGSDVILLAAIVRRFTLIKF